MSATKKTLYAGAMALGLSAAVGGVEQQIELDDGGTVLEHQLATAADLLTPKGSISRAVAYDVAQTICETEDHPATGLGGIGLMVTAEVLRRKLKQREENEAEWDQIRKKGLSPSRGTLNMTTLPEEIAKLIKEDTSIDTVNFPELTTVSPVALRILVEGGKTLCFQKLNIAKDIAAVLSTNTGSLLLGPDVKISPSDLQALIGGFKGQRLVLDAEIIKGQMDGKTEESSMATVGIRATSNSAKTIAMLTHFQAYKGEIIFTPINAGLTFEVAVALKQMKGSKITLRVDISVLLNLAAPIKQQLAQIGRDRLQISDLYSGTVNDGKAIFG